MRVAVTGTPGTGKTSATEYLETELEIDALADFEVVHLNDVIRERGFSTERDEQRDSLVADMEAVSEWLDGRDDIVVESHLAHQLPMDRVVVLRCHPEELEARLTGRGESETSVAENAESEALDIVLSEAVDRHGLEGVYEIDATDRDVPAVAREIARVVTGEREPSAGEVSFVDYL